MHRPPRRPLATAAAAAGAAALLALLLAGCAVTAVAPPPPMQAPARFKEAAPAAADPATARVPDDWWTLFGDARLNALEQRVGLANNSLRSAAAAVAVAQAALQASRSAQLPTLSVGPTATRSRSPGPLGAPATSIGLQASAGWELDLWDRLGQASRGAAATLQASQADLAAARLSVQALLAQTYFALCTADAQIELLARSEQAYARALALTQARQAAGVVTLSDVLQAQTQWQNVRAQQADARAQRAQLEHAIAVLLGEPPADFALPPAQAVPQLPPVPALLPARLLERRPDVAAARQRVLAAYAQIGVADAARLPDLVLSASGGWRAATVGALVSPANLLWSLGAALAAPLLDGGQRAQASATARAAAEAAVANYRQAALAAMQEVEDNLALTERLHDEAQAQQAALAAARRNLQIVEDQYRGGTVSYLNVVAAQTSALASEAAGLALRNRQWAAANQLLKNLAGRWDDGVGPGDDQSRRQPVTRH